MYKVLYERDLLYPTEDETLMGCVHVEVLDPDMKNRIPVIIEGKTDHSPIKYIDPIISMIQKDIFDRISLDIKQTVSVYIKNTNNSENNSPVKAYTMISFDGNSIEYKDTDDIII